MMATPKKDTASCFARSYYVILYRVAALSLACALLLGILWTNNCAGFQSKFARHPGAASQLKGTIGARVDDILKSTPLIGRREGRNLYPLSLT